MNCKWESASMLKFLNGSILLSSATNMVTQSIYLGRIEVLDWYYAVVLFRKYFLMGFMVVWTQTF